jgi:hypothetical protein
MNVVLGVSELDARGLEEVERGATRLLEDLGYEASVKMENTSVPSINGNEFDLGADFPGGVSADPPHRFLSQLACRRVALIAEVCDSTRMPADERAARLIHAWLGIAWRPSDLEATMGELTLAARMLATDAHPLQFAVHPDTAHVAFTDLEDADEALRGAIYDVYAVPLPPALVADPGCPPATIVAHVREVRFPALPLSAEDSEEAGSTLGHYAAWLVRASLPALVTPAAVNLALATALPELPRATSLAESRWAPQALGNLVRVRLPTLEAGPEDWPALIDGVSIAEAPRSEVDADPLVHLYESFPGVATGLARYLPDFDPSYELKTRILAGANSATRAHGQGPDFGQGGVVPDHHASPDSP